MVRSPSPSQPRLRQALAGATRSGTRWPLIALLAATALFRMTQNMAATTLSLLAGTALHFGAGAIGALGAVSGLTVAGATLLLSRRVPHERAAGSAAAGMAVLAGSLLVLGMAPSYPVLMAGAILLGGAGGIVMPGLLNALVSRAGERREQFIAVYSVTLSVSLAIGPVLETLVLTNAHQDVRLPYLVFAGLPALGAGLLVLGWRPRRLQPVDLPLSDAEVAGQVLAGKAPMPCEDIAVDVLAEQAATFDCDQRDEPSDAPARARWQRGLLATHAGRVALVAELLYMVPFAGVTVFGALVARVGFGVTPAKAQLGFTIFFVWSFVARALVAFRAPIVHKRALLWLSAGLTASGLALLGTGHGLLGLLVAMGILGIPHGLTFPLALAMVADATSASDLPRANATLLGSTNLTAVIVPLVLGSIVPAVGYQNMILVLLGPVALFAFMQFSLRPRERALQR